MRLGALCTLGHVISHVMSANVSMDEEKMDTSDSSTLSKDTVQQAVLKLSKLFTYQSASTYIDGNPSILVFFLC